MCKKLKFILIVLGAILASLIGIILIGFLGIYIFFSVFNPCTNVLISSSDSPNGTYTAHTFSRDCGATTSVSYHLSILKKDKVLKNKSGNTFVAEETFGVEWKDEYQLNTTYSKSVKTYQMDKKVGRVAVRYLTR